MANWSSNAKAVLAARYLIQDKDGRVIETPDGMLERVARNIAQAELIYGGATEEKEWADKFLGAMDRLDVLPNCLSTDSLVSTSEGLVPLEDIPALLAEDVITAVTDNGSAPIAAFLKNGPHHALKITTERGYTITATPEHHFRVIDSSGRYVWKQLKDVASTDYLALQKDFCIATEPPALVDKVNAQISGALRRSITFPSHMTEELAELLGFLMGNGSIKKVRGVPTSVELAINSRDTDLIEYLSSLCERLFSIQPHRTKVPGKNCVLLTMSSRTLIELLERNGLLKEAHKPRVPDKIMRSPPSCIAAFLRGVFEADGSCGSRSSIELGSAYKRFAEQLQLLLLGIGIVSRLSPHREMYRLSVNRDLSGKKYAEKVGFLSFRKKAVCLRFMTPKHHKDFIPNQNSRFRDWYKRLGSNLGLYRKFAHCMIASANAGCVSLFLLQKHTESFPELKSCYLHDLAALNQTYERVASVEDTAVETADLRVPGKETYVANGFVTHNSPCLINSGRQLQMLSACFVVPIADSIEQIFEMAKQTALIAKAGGGTGFNFSKIRPQGARIGSTQGTASGPISFMSVFDNVSEVVKQGGVRRGANMGVLSVFHPDILDFIDCKHHGAFKNFNISVLIPNAFMRLVAADADIQLSFRGFPFRESVKARHIFDRIVEGAWRDGEPGVLFSDAMNRDNPTPWLGKLYCTNPCSEAVLYPWESCNLASINISHFAKGRGLDWEKLEATTRLGVRFLDDMIDVNKYPRIQIARKTRLTRKVGLGVMGWADLLGILSMQYDTEEACSLATDVMGFISHVAHDESRLLGKERGFPLTQLRRRNACLTLIAPTGSLSILADCSSGIEPHFSRSFTRTVLNGVTLEFGIEYPVRTALEISPEWHIRMQAAFQKRLDMGCSKTINLPHEATREDVRRAYLLAHELGCKGVTVYRQGSRKEAPYQEVMTLPATQELSECENGKCLI